MVHLMLKTYTQRFKKNTKFNEKYILIIFLIINIFKHSLYSNSGISYFIYALNFTILFFIAFFNQECNLNQNKNENTKINIFILIIITFLINLLENDILGIMALRYLLIYITLIYVAYNDINIFNTMNINTYRIQHTYKYNENYLNKLNKIFKRKIFIIFYIYLLCIVITIILNYIVYSVCYNFNIEYVEYVRYITNMIIAYFILYPFYYYITIHNK